MSGPSAVPSWRRRAAIGIALGAACYIALALWGGVSDFGDALRTMGWGPVAIAFAAATVNYALRFLRWQYFLRLISARVPTLMSLRIYIAGFAMAIVPGRVGEAIRSLYLQPHGVRVADSIGCFLSERISDLASMLIVMSLAIAAYPPARSTGVALAVLVLAGLAGLWLLRALLEGGRIDRAGHGKWFEHAASVIVASGRCLAPAPLVVGLMLGVVAWGIEGLALYGLVHASGETASASLSVLAYSFGSIVGALTFLPGGLGGTEATMLAVFMFGGVSRAVAVASTFVIRVATLWFAVVLGVLAMGTLGSSPESAQSARA